jgi:beta,beta-carotene 9',10'-dioxygenase
MARPAGVEEDDGVLLSVVLDIGARSSFLLVLDAATLGELARASAPHHIPFGFHGNYFSNPERQMH